MIKRLAQNVIAFASNATAGKRYVFGTTTASDDIDDNVNANILKGWESGLDANGKPPMSWFNGLVFTVTKLIAYLYQEGIPKYEATQEYYVNSIVMEDDVIYISIDGVDGTPNVGNLPSTSTTKWEIYRTDTHETVMIVHDVKASGTDGGTFNSGARRTRDINTVVKNTITGASLSSNQITLPQGEYEVYSTAVAFNVDSHQSYIEDVTNNVTLCTSASRYASNTVEQESTIIDTFTLSAETTIELQHESTGSQTDTGFGTACSFGDEIYAQIKIKKAG